MARSELFSRPQVGGAYVFTDESRTTGTIFFVHSGTGTNSASGGQTPDNPLATLDYAMGLCTASKGDRIYLMPGHAETLAGAAGVAMDVAGVQVFGLGTGRLRPTFTFSAVASSFDISAANCHVENLVFLAGEDHTAMVNVTAASCVIRNCEVVLATTSKEAVIGVLASASGDRLVIEGCHFHDIGVAGCDHAISFGACDHAVIRSNVIVGLFAVGGPIENSAAAVDVLIEGNKILNRTPDGNNTAIVLHGSTTGLVASNGGGVIDSMSPAPVTAAAAFVAGNYFSSAAGVTASVLM